MTNGGRAARRRWLAVVLGAVSQLQTPIMDVNRSIRPAADLARGDGLAWNAAAQIAWGEAPYTTRLRALSDDAGLWVRFDADDPSPWHTYTERDHPLWDEEVVEIFIDPDGDGRNYAEIEISPANVVCDLLMRRGDPDKQGDIAWDFAGLQSWVHVWDTDTPGWTAIAFLPWDGFVSLPDTDVALPPRPGDRWRFNVFRIKRPHGPDEPLRDLVLAAWSPVPGNSFHVPEVFRDLVFVD